MNESPAFKKMKEEGTSSKAPLREAFGNWKNGKFAIIALLGLVAGQAVVWYSGQFYALFFLQNVIKVDFFTANVLVAWSLILGTGGFLFFGALSDRIGRKPIILAGCIIAALTYFPVFEALTRISNPVLHAAHQTPVVVHVAPEDCSFQFNPTGTAKFTSSCDIAKAQLDNTSVAKANHFFDIFTGQKLAIVAILTYLIILVTMVYGPIAAALVELFPTRIRYSGLSLPYHIGNGWFGGLMPATAFAISAQSGNVYAGLWYPIVVAVMTVIIGAIFVPGGTHRKDIFAEDTAASRR
jgi:hypothetical protein